MAAARSPPWMVMTVHSPRCERRRPWLKLAPRELPAAYRNSAGRTRATLNSRRARRLTRPALASSGRARSTAAVGGNGRSGIGSSSRGLTQPPTSPGNLNELTDDEYDAPSLLPGWSRRFVIAHVGYNARAIARLVEWARTGVETPMYESVEQRDTEITYGAALNPVALRNLHHHAAVALNVEWRDLPADAWANRVRTIQGREVPVTETVWMRTREVWLHAVDLGNSGSSTDFPPELVDHLLADVATTWRRRGVGDDLDLQPTNRPMPRDPEQGPTVIHGTAAQLARWATGRWEIDVTSSTGDVIRSPRWP